MNDRRICNLISINFSILGIMCITSGLIMPNLVKFENAKVEKLVVNQRRVSEIKTNEIVLKEIELEVGKILSVNSSDYLKNPNNIDNSIKKRLLLDISNVNCNAVGNYSYTITYNKKIYKGSVIVKDKPLPIVDVMTLNDLSLEINNELPTDISYYIKETLTDEIKAAIKIDLSNVDITKAGKYLYSISYNGKFYTSTVTMYEPKSSEDKLTSETTNTDEKKVLD